MSDPADFENSALANLTQDEVEIETTDIPLHVLASQAEDELIKANSPIYVRGPQLVRPVVDEVEASRGRTTKVARLAPISSDSMVDHLSRAIKFKRHDKREKKNVHINPPRQVANTILARDGEWKFPRLAGVITAPTIRPDGSLLVKPGYDPKTRLLLVEYPPMPSIPEKPTKADAEKALDRLKNLLLDFPFTDEASRSVSLSGKITPVIRGAIPVAPLHANRAPMAGTGKSYDIDLNSAIATGQACPVIAAGKTDEETEKRLGAILMTGQPIVSIDNVNGPLGGDALCQFVERPLVGVRVLGQSQIINIENRATIFATGNNICLLGDMVRRTIMCSLDASVERPELRRFVRNPLFEILNNRGEYIAAALTIVRAYVVADFPGALAPLNSFENWSRLVRSSLVWLGCADPVLTMETARDEDPDTTQVREVVAAWRIAVGLSQPKTVSELTLLAAKVGYEGFYAALRICASDGERLDSKRLGYWLKRKRGRVIDDLKIVGIRDSSTNQTKWSLVAAGDAGQTGCDSGSRNNIVINNTDILACNNESISVSPDLRDDNKYRFAPPYDDESQTTWGDL